LLGITHANRSNDVLNNLSMGLPTAISRGLSVGIPPVDSLLVSKISQRGEFDNLISTDDDKIHFLRKVAQDVATEMSLDPTQIFIRYKRRYPKWSKCVYEYTTALPWHRGTSKRKFDESGSEAEGHRRWLYKGGGLRRGIDPRYYERLEVTFRDSSDVQRVPGDFLEFHRRRNSQALPGTDRDSFTIEEQRSIHQEFENRKRFYASLGEDTFERESEFIEDFEPQRMGLFWDNMGCASGMEGRRPWY